MLAHRAPVVLRSIALQQTLQALEHKEEENHTKRSNLILVKTTTEKPLKKPNKLPLLGLETAITTVPMEGLTVQELVYQLALTQC